MNRHSDTQQDWDKLREKIIGLGERSIRKSYYPEFRQRLERFRALLDKSNDIILLLEIPTGRIADASESATRDLGYSRDALLGMSFYDLVDPSEIAEVAQFLAQDPGSNSILRVYTSAYRTPAGESVPV
ncbi:MAG TPA: PAS domain-containing protein, partial [Armatimonadota bacterium]